MPVRQVRGAFAAATAVLRGTRLVRGDRVLKRLALAPLAINTVLFAIGIAVFVAYFDELLEAATAFLAVAPGDGIVHAIKAGLAAVARFLVGAVMALAFAAAVFFSFTLVGNLIGAPFHELLSMRAERLASGQATAGDDAFQLAALYREAAYAVGQELRRIGTYALVMAPLLLLWLIPGIGAVLFGALATVVTAYFLAFEHLDLPMSRRRLRFREKRALLAHHRLGVLAFGGVALALMAIPFVNLLVLPLQVVAGTLLFVEWTGMQDPGRSQGAPTVPAAAPLGSDEEPRS